MLKLLVKIFVIVVVLEAASLVFLEEMLLTTLILVTIALTTASLMIKPQSARASVSSTEPQPEPASPIHVTSRSGLETFR